MAVHWMKNVDSLVVFLLLYYTRSNQGTCNFHSNKFMVQLRVQLNAGHSNRNYSAITNKQSIEKISCNYFLYHKCLTSTVEYFCKLKAQQNEWQNILYRNKTSSQILYYHVKIKRSGWPKELLNCYTFDRLNKKSVHPNHVPNRPCSIIIKLLLP